MRRRLVRLARAARPVQVELPQVAVATVASDAEPPVLLQVVVLPKLPASRVARVAPGPGPVWASAVAVVVAQVAAAEVVAASPERSWAPMVPVARVAALAPRRRAQAPAAECWTLPTGRDETLLRSGHTVLSCRRMECAQGQRGMQFDNLDSERS